MANYNCNCKARCFASNAISQMNAGCDTCVDVCTNPICGTPDALLLYAPVTIASVSICADRYLWV